jgi:hypothetical protein
VTDFQRIEKWHQLGALGDKKPSGLLSSNLELCPLGHETNKFFLFLFLQHLLTEHGVLLGSVVEPELQGAETFGRSWSGYMKYRLQLPALVPGQTKAVH